MLESEDASEAINASWAASLFDIAAARASSPAGLLQQVVAALARDFRLDACTVFAHIPRSNQLQLVGQSGLDFSSYGCFELTYETLAGACAISREILSCTVSQEGEYVWNDYVASACHDMSVTAIPVSVDQRAYWPIEPPVPALVFCLYSHSAQILSTAVQGLVDNIPLISSALESTIDSTILELRERVVREVAYSGSVNAAATTMLDILLSELAFTDAALFLSDEHTEQTYPAAARNLNEKDLAPIPVSNSHTVKRVIASGHGTVVEETERAAHYLALDLGAPIRHAIALPLAEAAGKSNRSSSFGCLVLANPRLTLGLDSREVSTSWVDELLARLAVQMISVIFFQLQTSRDLANRFERALHGAKATLRGAEGALQSIVLARQIHLNFPDRGQAVSDDVMESVRDAQVWIGELINQVERQRHARRGVKIRTSPIPLYADILYPLADLAVASAAARRLPLVDFRFDVAGGDDLTHLPRVLAHREALASVFRNVLDNAIKYSDVDSSRIGIRIAVRRSTSRIYVTVADSGIGVPEGEQDKVFDMGFRGEIPRQRVPDGLGIGLADCRSILRKLDGEIRLAEYSDPQSDYEQWTAFEIGLKIAVL